MKQAVLVLLGSVFFLFPLLSPTLYGSDELAEETKGPDSLSENPEPVSEKPKVPGGSIDEIISAIEKKYDAMKWESATFEYPKCEEVFERRVAESREVFEQVFGVVEETLSSTGGSSLQARLKEMSLFFPSVETINSKALPKTIVGLNPESEDGELAEEELNREPEAYFGADTLIYRAQEIGPKVTDKHVKISEIKEGDYILSTTAHLVDDERYKVDCLAQVQFVVKHPVRVGSVGYLKYRNQELNEQGVIKPKIVASSHTCLYCRFQNTGAWEDNLCKDIEAQASDRYPDLYSVQRNEENPKYCRFITFEPSEQSEPVDFYNLIIRPTGSYYVGETGSEILVRN